MNTRLYKYPRTPHLPWSPGATPDDIFVVDNNIFVSDDIYEHNYVVVTEKRDGECTTFYPDHIHARSIDSKDHESRHIVKALHAQVRRGIPEGFRICGENLYAKHSIYYTDLISYFEVFSIWNDDMCLSWEETVEWCIMLDLQPVPEMMRGSWTDILPKLKELQLDLDKQEGYVVRTVNPFTYDSFHKNVAKFVRKGHVQTDKHWMYQKIIPNKLRVT